MRRAGAAAAVAAVLALTAGCAATEWPSDADQSAFCEKVGQHYLHGPDEELRRLGTPENLPFEARRYLLHRDEGKEPVPGDQEILQDYVADRC
ncbi:hypothetical protein [Nocardioides sp. LML1-1-1.1]|uniref:hypothetical protein n=1 Tax=Nocardioides sp. LML1-1-1.1 TaxID=3135248 RepID=UPI0034459968